MFLSKGNKLTKKLAMLLASVMMLTALYGCQTQPAGQTTEEPPVQTTEAPTQTTEEAVTVKMAPGSYQEEVYGYSLIEPMQVTVTVDETKITGIEIETDWQKTRENGPIVQSVINLMIPRILENQSIEVDVITGATASSAAVKYAVRLALEEALEAGGSDASAIAAFEVEPVKESGVETITTDILVVGMGGSGSAAATAAAQTLHEAGKEVNVLAIDKAGKYGGSSANAGEMLAVNPEKFQDEFNDGKDYVEDVDAFYQQWLGYTVGGEKADLVKLYIEESGDTMDWLIYEHGFEFNRPASGLTKEASSLTRYGYAHRLKQEENHEYKHDINSIGTRTQTVTSYFDTMLKNYQSYGGKYMLEVEAYELLTDETGSVVGVKARSTGSDKEYIINAKQVIMACGGFGGNADMINEYLTDEPYPSTGNWNLVYGMQQNKGTLMQYAIKELGAGTKNIDLTPMVHIKSTAGVIRDYEVTEYEDITGGYVFLGRPAVWGVGGSIQNLTLGSENLWVNLEGNRICSETSFWDYWKNGPDYFSIVGEKQIADIVANGFKYEKSTNGYSRGDMKAGIPVPELYDVIDKAVAQGIAYKADTLEELAKMMGVPAENLVNTVKQYNGYCETGVDEQFGKADKYLVSLGEEGPYYCFKGKCALYSTCGGLDVDTSMRVLKADGTTAINGLYAVGTDSMGVLYSDITDYNIPYGGEALGWAFTSGKIAGEAAADALK